MQVNMARLDVPVVSNYKNLYEPHIADNDLVLALSAPGEIFLSEDPFAYEYVLPGQMEFAHPNDFYDVIVLNKVLETYLHEQRFELLDRLRELLGSKGKIVSISTACYDSYEAYTLLSEYDLNLIAFENDRLLNKHILELQPDYAAFSEVIKNFSNRKELVKYLRSALQIEDASLEHLWRASEPFQITRLMIGLVWQEE